MSLVLQFGGSTVSSCPISHLVHPVQGHGGLVPVSSGSWASDGVHHGQATNPSQQHRNHHNESPGAKFVKSLTQRVDSSYKVKNQDRKLGPESFMRVKNQLK